MWWKVLLGIVVLWLAFGIIVAIAKGILWLAVVGLIVVGAVTVARWFSKDQSSTGTYGS